MYEPIETIIVRAQQNFDIVGGLNPIQIEIEDDRVLNILTKHKNVLYRVTPLGILRILYLTLSAELDFLSDTVVNVFHFYTSFWHQAQTT